jgi:hypothetical protein
VLGEPGGGFGTGRRIVVDSDVELGRGWSMELRSDLHGAGAIIGTLTVL